MSDPRLIALAQELTELLRQTRHAARRRRPPSPELLGLLRDQLTTALEIVAALEKEGRS